MVDLWSIVLCLTDISVNSISVYFIGRLNKFLQNQAMILMLHGVTIHLKLLQIENVHAKTN